MKMDFKDYYQILGVTPQADNKTIKKAYQALTKKYHPDLHPGDKEAEEKFKEINEAYHAIADPAKRQKYDDLRANYQQWQERGGRGSFDWSSWQGSPGQGTYTRTMTPEEFAEMFGDTGFGQRRGSGGFSGGFSDFFSTIFGMGNRGDFYEHDEDYAEMNRKPYPARNIEGEISITLEEAYHGSKRLIDIGNRRIEATIPKGIKHDRKIRLAGQGNKSAAGGRAGDLLLTIKILPHSVFTQEGDDLHENVEIDFYTAVLGGEVKVKTMTGDVLLKIPPRTQTGKILRLQNKGMPIVNQDGKFGDLYAKMIIVLPENLSDKEIDMLNSVYQDKVKSG